MSLKMPLLSWCFNRRNDTCGGGREQYRSTARSLSGHGGERGADSTSWANLCTDRTADTEVAYRAATPASFLLHVVRSFVSFFLSMTVPGEAMKRQSARLSLGQAKNFEAGWP